MIAFYYVLLLFWVPLLWPAFRLTGGARIWLLIVVGLAAVATLHEIRMTFWAIAAIRLDIFLITIVLLVLYAIAAAVLIGYQWPKAGATLGVALSVIAGGMAWTWTSLGDESARVMEAFETGNGLLFEAKFRDAQTYERYFGPFGTATHPTGHWVATSDTHFTRLIVNAAGRVWLFYRCGATECHNRSAAAALHPGDGVVASDELAWEAILQPRSGAPYPVRIAPRGSDGLAATVYAQTITFSAAPPPMAPTPPVAALDYLGAFASVACTSSGQHADVRQLWLWREGLRVYAVGIFDTPIAGQRADVLSPIVLGEGRPDGDQWRFDWPRDNPSRTATIGLDDPANPTLTFERKDLPTEELTLRRPAIVQDEVIDLAALTGKPAWDHWFANVLVGHFSAADIPAC